MVIRHLKWIGRVKTLDNWILHELTANQKISILKCCFLLFYATTTNCFLIRLDCDTQWKVDFIQPAMTSSVAGLRKSSKAFLKDKLVPKDGRGHWWSAAHQIHYSLLNLAKPMHLRNMLSKLMRCTKKCNACSQHWSTLRVHFFSRITTNSALHNQCFKSRINWAMNPEARVFKLQE